MPRPSIHKRHIAQMSNFFQSYLALFHGSYTFRVLGESFTLIYAILPGLIIGLAISAVLIASRPAWLWKKRKDIHGFGAILLMSFLGIVSPFCTYMAIPISASMIASGMVPSTVFAFLFATPLMNPNLFFMTFSAFGWPMATARSLSALGFGLIGGVLGSVFSERIASFMPSSSRSCFIDTMDQPQADTFFVRWHRSLRHQSWFVIKYVLLGIIVASAMKELIPMRWIEAAVGRSHGYSVLVGALLGIPLYACGGGSIPIVQVLLSMGMSPGAALAFFIAGPATKIPNLLAMQMTMGFPVTVSYIVLNLIWSVCCGLLFQLFIDLLGT